MNPEELLAEYAAGRREFPAMNLAEANFSGANLSGIQLNDVDLNLANLTNTNLSGASLQRSRLTIAKLSGVNLSNANLKQVNLSLAHLTLADLQGASLVQANLIKAELARADLTDADLRGATLSSADLKDAKLRRTSLRQTNLSRADLRRSVMTAANLEQATLHSADLSGADLSGANLSLAELRQTNLSRANLQGANLSGANLRWADLSGANLRWADLSGAILSGANLTGADLSGATLLGTTLVHVDLTRANLASVDWRGADLTGAQLTGCKLYDTLSFGPKVEGVSCKWIDLSRNGDRSQTYQFPDNSVEDFFEQSAPTVKLIVDSRVDSEAHAALAVAYQQLVRQSQLSLTPPNLTIHRRRTILTFELTADPELFMTAYAAIFPFEDAQQTQRSLTALLKQIPSQIFRQEGDLLQRFQKLITLLSQQRQLLESDRILQVIPTAAQKLDFFQAPTQMHLINSKLQTLAIYSNPFFGKRSVPFFKTADEFNINALPKFQAPSQDQVIEFITGFRQPTIATHQQELQ
jgi:uncharacterized protein YjbI with pentapeptide repeats